MPDKTSDDYLNQPEPVVEEGPKSSAPMPSGLLDDDPVVPSTTVDALQKFYRDSAPPTEDDASQRPSVAPDASRSNADRAAWEDALAQEDQDSTLALQRELEELKKQVTLLKMAPQERYPKVLSEADIPIEEAHRILDRVIVQLKPWREQIEVNKHVTLVLQTRGQYDIRRLDEWAERTKPEYNTTVYSERLMNSMASALVAYNQYRFDGADVSHAERWKAAYDFLEGLPYPAFRLVQSAVAAFDQKINTVFSDGFLENF